MQQVLSRATRGIACVALAHTHSMTDSAWRDDVVIVHDLSDGSIYEFSTYVEQPDGSLLMGDNIESEATFHRVDGERLAAVLSANGIVERLIPTGERNLSESLTFLAEYASREGIAWDSDDPKEFLLALRRRDHAKRWPRYPKWLDRWMHGPAPH